MKKTLLQIVQDILAQADSEDVNTIAETVESDQVATICSIVFDEMIIAHHVPEHEELIKLTAASDSAFPTHFHYPTNVSKVKCVWYKDSDGLYHELTFIEPLDFLNRTDGLTSNYTAVADKNGGTTLRIGNNKDPRFYTSFDDYWIVMDSHDSTVDSTLQESKVRAYGTRRPVFSKTDSYVPDLDENLFPLYLNECTGRYMSLLGGGPDPKVEKALRIQKTANSKHRHRQSGRGSTWRNYGR